MSTAPTAAGQRSTTRGFPGGGARPRIRLLMPPIRRSWRPSFVSVCVTLMIACLSALLGINIVLTRGAYVEQQLTLKQTALMEQEQGLTERVARASAPETLAQRARDLGMIPNYSPAFIRMSDGIILGVPTPATIATTPKFGDLSGTPLSPEQAAAAAAAANGGVPVVGADGVAAGEVVTPGEAAPDDPSLINRPEEGASSTPTNDGAVLVGPSSAGTEAATAPEDASAGSASVGSASVDGDSAGGTASGQEGRTAAGEAADTSTDDRSGGDGARLVEGNQ